MLKRKSIMYFGLGVLLLNILSWGTWFIYDITDTCFLPLSGDGCKQASWGFAFFLGVQVPLAAAVFALSAKGAQEFSDEECQKNRGKPLC